jgi:hypothetical protein
VFGFIKSLFSNKKNTHQVTVSTTLIANDEINPAREMLKEATVLKKEKKYDEACEKLKEAFSLDGAGDLMVKERMRLPMYLQLAKRNDEGWRILNELNIKYTDVFSQAEIANQMRVFLQKEKKYTQAVLFSIWSICKEVERDRQNIQGSIELADQWASNKDDFGILSEGRNEKVYGKTPKGNPITDSAYKMFNDRIDGSISKEGVTDRILPLLKKAKKEQLTDNLSEAISKYLKTSEYYDLREVRDIINTILMSEETDV